MNIIKFNGHNPCIFCPKKPLNIGIFFMLLKCDVCVIMTCVEMFMSVAVLVTLTSFQGHGRVNKITKLISSHFECDSFFFLLTALALVFCFSLWGSVTRLL